MSSFGSFFRRLWFFSRREQLSRELHEEMAQHIEERAASNMAAGMPAAEARAAAMRGFGNSLLAVEHSRDHWGFAWLETLWQDFRFAVRMLRKNGGFTAAAVVTLALGIGANTAIFSVVNAVLLRPFPYPHPDRLMALRGNQSFPDVIDLSEQVKSFAAVGAVASFPFDLVGEGEPQRIDSEIVGGDMFALLGVEPLLGRTFSEADDRALAHVVVVSYDFWRRHLNSDPVAIGRQLMLSGGGYSVIGVMPAQFRTPFFQFTKADLWIPMRVGYPDAATEGARGAHFMLAAARLKDGVSPGQAQAELDVVGKHLGELHPVEARTFNILPLRDRVVGSVRTPLLILLGAVGLVLLIACSNFATLLLARTVVREQEMQVRNALGASRSRLLRQLLTESATIALLGGIMGVLLARLTLTLLLQLKPAKLPSFYTLSLDRNTLAFAILVSLMTGLVFGTVPGLQFWSKGEIKPSGSRVIAGRSVLRRVLVAVEISLALVLMIGAGLLIRSLWRLQTVTLGFNPNGLLTMQLSLPASRYGAIDVQEQFLQRLDRNLQSMPGIHAAGLVTELPLSGNRMMHNMIVEGQPAVAPGQEPEIYTHEVSPAFFRAIGTRVLLGRDFRESDTAAAPWVGIVNEAFARRFFPGRSPIGARARWARGGGEWITVVGVVPDIRYEAMDEPQDATIYTPNTQKQQIWKRFTAIVVRPRSGDPMALAASVRQQVWDVDAQLPITHVETMSQLMQVSQDERRFNTILLSMFAGLAFLLAVVGIYGIVAHLVSQRTREVGIRVALGARRGDILWLMLRQGVVLIGSGLLAGAVGAMLLTRLLNTLLYDVRSTDPPTFALVIAALAGVALVAIYIPARRAMRVDPMVALRYE